eukprot:586274_1
MDHCISEDSTKYICRLIDDCVAYIDSFDFDTEAQAYQIQLQEILDQYKQYKSRRVMSKLVPDWLYLGDVNNAESFKQLKRNKINYIINMDSGFISVDYPKAMNINTLAIDAEDQDNYKISDHFDECIKFINKCKNDKGKILIHCYAGMNRSVAICIAYLLQSQIRIDDTKEHNLLNITEYVMSKRGRILTNTGFQRQLIEYSRSINRL